VTGVYFYLTRPDKHEGFVPVAYGQYDPDLYPLLSKGDRIDGWSPRQLVVESDELEDYLVNNVGVRLCSSRMRDIIDRNLGPRDEVQWLEAEVTDISGTSHDYYVLHLIGGDGAVDEKRSIMVRDFVVKPVIDITKTVGRNLLTLPGGAVRFFVSDDVRGALLDAGITGVSFHQAPS